MSEDAADTPPELLRQGPEIVAWRNDYRHPKPDEPEDDDPLEAE